MIKAAFTLLAVVSAGVAFAACGGEPGAAVATVDGEPIDQLEFDHWLVVAAKSAGNSDALPDPSNKREYAQLRDQVMQLLISFRWIEGEATAMGVVVSDAELQKSFADQKRQSFPKQADYEKFLRTSGQTHADILRRVKLDLLSNKIRDQVVAGAAPVTAQDIRDYYAKHKRRFVVPEQRDLRLVLTKRRAEADQARGALMAGQSWRAVAKRYSIDPETRRSGGRLPAQAKGTLEAKLDNAVFSAPKDTLIGPLKTSYGY